MRNDVLPQPLATISMHGRTLYILIILVLIIRCNPQPRHDYERLIKDYDVGINKDYYQLITSGPESSSVNLFDPEIISRNNIWNCNIIQVSSDTNKSAKYVEFDSIGNIIFERNDYFWDMKGTMCGTYYCKFKDSNIIESKKGVHEADSKDSIHLICNYDSSNNLVSKDFLEYSRRLKDHVDWDLLSDDDFEKLPTWHLTKTKRYFSDSTNVIIQTVIEDEVRGFERYKMQFDTINRVTQIECYWDIELKTREKYSYSLNSILETWEFYYYGEVSSIRHLAVMVDSFNRPIERKIVMDGDISASSTTIISYYPNGTIKKIDRGDWCQIFEYNKN